MNKLTIYFFLAITFLFTACGDDDSSSNPVPTGPTYEDQALQGTVYGESWTIQSGAVVSLEGVINADKYSHGITLRSVSDTNICSRTFGAAVISFPLPEEKSLSIRIETDNELLETGTYTFGDTDSDGDGVLNFTDWTANGVSQTGFTGGSMQITRVDTTAGVVEGKIVASDGNFDTNSSVNGNFTADYCRP
jgi:hypothetical protein